MTTAIIYNHCNADAVIAAAILRTVNPTFKAVDLRSHIPAGMSCYIWIGTEQLKADPNKHNGRVPKEAPGTLHQVFHLDIPSVHAYPDELPEEGDTYRHTASLVEQVCRCYQIVNKGYQRVGFHIGSFHESFTAEDHDTAIMLQVNIREAERSLFDQYAYEYVEPDGEARWDYKVAVSDARSALAGQFYLTHYLDGCMVKKLAVLSVSDRNVHMALRLIRMVHQHFYLTYTGLNGPVVYTNLKDLSNVAEAHAPIRLS